MPHVSRRSFGKQALSGVSGIAILASFPLFGHRHSSWGAPPPKSSFPVSGRYPHLAMFNHSLECGTGAVVPWADRLWVVTYSPHRPGGSDDGLYEITPELEIVKRKESIGGTPACRMIHRESNQLFIGPYAIDQDRKVRPISYAKMRGRLTARLKVNHACRATALLSYT